MDSTDRAARAGAVVSASAYPNEEPSGHAADGGRQMVLLALSHTPAEHQLYLALLKAAAAGRTATVASSIRHLMLLSGLPDFSAVRRARAGLEKKLSVEYRRDETEGFAHYTVLPPAEIFVRRREAGINAHPEAAEDGARRESFSPALARALEARNLSRRECQVALHCAEGCTNAEIGERLGISEDTVKFHLRHVFAKLGVRRRAELVARLLTEG